MLLGETVGCLVREPTRESLSPRWSFDSKAPEIRIRAAIQAQRSAFVGLRYANLPGGEKTCLNSELAACELLADDREHGIPVLA
jgi:hypothetical protein